MFSKVIVLALALSAVYAEEHGHAYSSQSIVHHQVSHPHHEEHHAVPIVHHAIPVVHHEIPVVHHAIPVVHHVAPVVHHVSPVVHHVAPVAHHVAPGEHKAAPVEHNEEHHEEYYGHPKYEFSYHVEDKHTGDIKSQHESRDGHLVKGEYSLHQPDGIIRTVKYSADKHTGFNADVHYSGHSQHVEPQHHY